MALKQVSINSKIQIWSEKPSCGGKGRTFFTRNSYLNFVLIQDSKIRILLPNIFSKVQSQNLAGKVNK